MATKAVNVVLFVLALSVCEELVWGRVCYSQRSSTYRCGRRLRRRRCTRYHSAAVCCSGWSGTTADGCPYAICDGKTNLNGACTLKEGYVKESASGPVHEWSGGECNIPGFCSKCNNGYYADEAYCRECPPINNCFYTQCTEPSDTRCKYCKGVVKDDPTQYGWWAFTRWVDGGLSCRRACSWRPGSRCYPGSCSDTTTATCQCEPGFTGTDCATMTEDPVILQSFARLKHVSGTSEELVEGPLDTSAASPQDTVWTNNVNLQTANVYIDALYVKKLPDLPNTPSEFYVKLDGSLVGIMAGGVSLQLQRGGSIVQSSFSASCPLSVPKPNNYRCEGNFNFSDKWGLPFQHQDTIVFEAYATNGGYMTVYDRENNNNEVRYNMNGKTLKYTFYFRIDTETPEHCVTSTNCIKDPLTVPDASVDAVLPISWDGWFDDVSGLKSYHIEVFHLRPTGTGTDSDLSHGEKVTNATSEVVSAEIEQEQVTVPNPGAYSLTITAFDNAGNQKTSRRVFVFDDQSVVELQGTRSPVADSQGRCTWQSEPSAPLVTNAEPSSNCDWINQATSNIDIVWKERFINHRHHAGQWLNPVEALDYVVDGLDDHDGQRQTSLTDNVLGVVKFEVSYNVTYESNEEYFPFEDIGNVYSERTTISETMQDGKRVNVTIRGYDITGSYADEVLVIKADASPPVITYLWLTRGDNLNISVHNVEELAELTIEWETYDYHSGIHEIQWRLYDNFTGDDVLHGTAFESPQGNTETKDQCSNTYGQYARGPSCYCTPFDGCFHQHFQVKPLVVSGNTSGILSGKHNGKHDSDYFIEVTVTNKAMLTTVLTKKITIDTSPPVAGTVHEGMAGDPEVDFQQSQTVHVHWNDFFDKESGVLFYKYGYGTQCLQADAFDIGPDMELITTYNAYTSFDVLTEGTYYVTVAAFNRALDHSEPVCSDGITIDTTVPKVYEVVVKGSRTRAGLLRSTNGSIWYIHDDRSIQNVHDPSESCRRSAEEVSDDLLDTFPRRRDTVGRIKDLNNTICDTLDVTHQDLVSVVSATVTLEISWYIKTPKTHIHDFRVGLGSTNTGEANVVPFQSSYRLEHIRLENPNIDDGETFFVVIETVSKSDMRNTQTIGPFLVDTSPPTFQGKITLTFMSWCLVGQWDADAFIDAEEDGTRLKMEFAIGTAPLDVDVHPFSNLQSGPGCTNADQYLCTAVNIDELHWSLHGHHTYYMTIKATNVGGQSVMATSDPYIHDVILPTIGIVLDIDDTVGAHVLDDVDFKTSLTSMKANWYGFDHAGTTTVYYKACVAEDGQIDDDTCKELGTITETVINDLHLRYFTMYQFVIIASSSAGNITVLSDGVTILDITDALVDIGLYDGAICDMVSDPDNSKFLHHDQDITEGCKKDISYQSSLNALSLHWEIPESRIDYTPDMFWHIEERAPFVDYWTNVTRRIHTTSSANHITTNHVLQSGRTYRFAVQFCADQSCFQEMYTDGVTITHNPPASGTIDLTYSETDAEIIVTLEKFRDSDIEDITEAREAISHYEWTISDNGHAGNILIKWTRVMDKETVDSDHLSFKVQLLKKIEITNCWWFNIRGYNKAGLYSVVSREVHSCNDKLLVPDPVVIDAVGHTYFAPNGTEISKPIEFERTELWLESDKDYTPVTNMISAIWPSLRYPLYQWAILEHFRDDALLYYHDASDRELTVPCDIPEAITCGQTDDVYINIAIDPGQLLHGKLYTVCIHADSTILKHEYWNETLPDISVCSDGVIVDITPPQPGDVWILQKGAVYQTSLSELTVYWDSFVDVEEIQNAAHSTGIMKYGVAIGSYAGGEDVMSSTDVGVTNLFTFHGLSLQNGHKYYVTVKGYDFTGKTAKSVSQPITVDSTPPVTSDVSINIGQRHITNTANVEPCWTGVFSDPDSGISLYKWGMGSRPGYDDVYPYTESVTECTRADQYVMSSLQEGSLYYISVRGYNGASLWTLATSWAFTVDFSPPNIGHVYDGSQDGEDTVKDKDYQIERHTLFAHWSGFSDQHTNIQDYFVSAGTYSGAQDIVKSHSVGLNQNVRLDHQLLTEGKTYYVTVTACNTASLCSSATSDGIAVDSSPPVTGRVNDGSENTDIQYQMSSDSVEAKWFGFVDPHSGISHYTWRVGTTPGSDDIVPTRDVHQSNVVGIANTLTTLDYSLPVGKRLYSTVRAYNKAGLWSESSSNGFIVDDTKPDIISPITQMTLGSIVPSTSILNSVMKFAWQIEDKDSSISRQYLSIQSHIGEDFNITTELYGFVRDYTFTELHLHDGSMYDVILMACNGARACVQSRIDNILVDTSPPTAGSFAINTDHAAELDRQTADWFLTWNATYINLAWLGFSDEHSGISHYMINVGSRYMASDVNQNVETSNVIYHDADTGHWADDGKVQVFALPTQPLTGYEHVFIALWAINKVGLRSEIVHSQFVLVPGGKMDLVRRCDSYTCQGHCVCAAQDLKCSLDDDAPTCNQVNADSNFASVTVSDLIYISHNPSDKVYVHTPANTMLSAGWNVTGSGASIPKWYETSAGLTEFDTPSGIFSSHERIWHDAANTANVYFTFKNGQTLYEGEKYSVFIRAWYNEKTFADFKSPGVIIQSRHLETSHLFGQAVKEVYKHNNKDLDYISVDMDISIDWTGKFKAPADQIWKYKVFIGTLPGGHDLHEFHELESSNTNSVNVTLQDFEIQPGMKYYSTVQALSQAGQHTAVVSDGFVLDTDLPKPGLVLDGPGVNDLQYQNSSVLLSTHWHGFVDLQSGVRSYRWCVSAADRLGTCNVIPSTNVGMKSHVSKELDMELENGMKIHSEVSALDRVGHVSPVVVSGGIIIDTTPPVIMAVNDIGLNKLKNPSFENYTDYVDLKDINPKRECTDGLVKSWITDGCSSVVVSSADTVKDGQSFVWIRGSISQTVTNLSPGKSYLLTFYVSHLPASNNVVSHEEGFVEFSDERHTFTIYSKPGRHDEGHHVNWQLFTFHLVSNGISNVVKLGTFTMSYGVAIDNVQLQEITHTITSSDDSANHVRAHMVFVHDWSSVHASWKFDDQESGIKTYMWAIGTVKGGTQLQDFWNIGTKTFGTNSNLHLPHMSEIHITVVATNGADLKTVSYSDPIIVDLTPPDISYVNDGLQLGMDLDFQNSFLVGINFEAEDFESNIDHCYWAIGISSGDISIQDFTEIPDGQRYTSVMLDDTVGIAKKLYITVRCVNNAGLITTRTSDGIQIIADKPSIDDVNVDVLEDSQTQYPVFDHFHGRSDELRIRWTGFKTSDWIDHYQVEITGDGYTKSVMVQDVTPGYVYTTFADLNLKDGFYDIMIRGVNKLNVLSDPIKTNVTILTTRPQFDETKRIDITWNKISEEATVSWTGGFPSQHQLYYEVSVGKSAGNVDIIQWQETKHDELKFKLPQSDVGVFGINIFAAVRAIYQSGMYTQAVAQRLVI